MQDLTREIYGNIDPTSKLVFYILAGLATVIFLYGIWTKAKKWRLRETSNLKEVVLKNMKRILHNALFQRKVRTGRKSAGLAHAALFFGFLTLFIGTILVGFEHYGAAILGREATNPIFHKGLYYVVFEFVMDFGGLLLLAGMIYFFLRKTNNSSSMEKKWTDWVVLSSLIIIGITGYLVEGGRIIFEQSQHAWISPIGYITAKLLSGLSIDRSNISGFHLLVWWVHSFAALSMIALIPFTRLMHIVAGIANMATRDYEMGNLESIDIEEVEETGIVGVSQINHLKGSQLLALDACVSCGRCQDVCPAYEAGKPLSPRDVVQNVKKAVEAHDFSLLKLAQSEEAPGLHGEYISEETLWSCTTCNACVDACPVELAPLEFITDMRRHLVAEGALRGAPAASLQKMQRSGNPWGLPQNERFNWSEGLDVPTVKDNPDFDVLYWVGCTASYDPRAQKIARAVVQLLNKAGVNYACLGNEEKCTGDSARRMGDEFLFQELAMENMEKFERYKVKKILAHCPHCLNSLLKDYPQFGGQFEVVHHSYFLNELVTSGKLKVGESVKENITYHDPCYLARVNDITKEPRDLVVSSIDNGNELKELKRSHKKTACCGAGGGKMWFDDAPSERIGQNRITEIQETGADTVAVSCPFCLTMVNDGLNARESQMEVKEISELLVEALQ